MKINRAHCELLHSSPDKLSVWCIFERSFRSNTHRCLCVTRRRRWCLSADLWHGRRHFFGDMLAIYPSAFIDLPNVRELDKDPLQVIATIIAFSDDSDHPIPESMTCVRVIWAADFLGSDQVLQVLSSRLGCRLQFLFCATPVSELRRYVRNRYRMTKLLFSKVDGGNCSVCRHSLYHAFPSKTLIGSITTTPCCTKNIHLQCYQDLPSCQVCSKELVCLPCVFCGERISGTTGNFYEVYATQIKNRLTKLIQMGA